MLEFGDGQAEALRGVFQEQKWIVEAMVEDYTHRLRIWLPRECSRRARRESARAAW